MDVSLVVDSAADRLIVPGGLTNEVWSLPLSGADENRWLRLFPEGERPPPSKPVSVYDPVGNRVLALLNGWNEANGDYDQVQLWELALTGTPRWRRLTPAGISPGREVYNGMLALDSGSHRLFVLGGALGGHGTWALALDEGGEWERIADAPPGTQTWTSFSAQLGTFLVFDAPRQRLVAFLGYEDWELSLENGRWSSLGADPCPSGRVFSTAVFDDVAERVLYNGGECGGTWTFSLLSNEWQGQVQAWSDDTIFGAAALDRRRDRMLLGFQGLFPVGNQIWQMPLATLEPEPLTANTRVAALGEGSTLVWDPVREAVVAFGGTKLQTWSRAPEAAGAWRALPVSANAGGWGESAVYDTAGSAIIAFGGTNGHDSVLRLASTADADWEPLAVSAGPGERSNAVGVYDSNERRLVIHGGVHDPSLDAGRPRRHLAARFE
jgi:hypothetical protein